MSCRGCRRAGAEGTPEGSVDRRAISYRQHTLLLTGGNSHTSAYYTQTRESDATHLVEANGHCKCYPLPGVTWWRLPDAASAAMYSRMMLRSGKKVCSSGWWRGTSAASVASIRARTCRVGGGQSDGRESGGYRGGVELEYEQCVHYNNAGDDECRVGTTCVTASAAHQV